MLGLLAFQMLPQLFSKGGTANMQVHDLYWSSHFWIYETPNLRSDAKTLALQELKIDEIKSEENPKVPLPLQIVQR